MGGAPDLYFDSMGQIHMNSWSSDRVALVGDAGYCASPLSGQGTSMALAAAEQKEMVPPEVLERASNVVTLPDYPLVGVKG